MVRGGKVSGKRNFRKKVRSKESGSDDSDEDYVVSDDGRDVFDCSEDYCPSSDGCEESFDGVLEEEEEIHRVRKFNRSKAQNGVRGRQKNASEGAQKRVRVTHAERLELEEQEIEGNEDDDDDEDFNYEEEEEFTPEEEDYSDEEEETRVRKKSNGMKMSQKVSQKKVPVTTTRGRKRKRSRAPKKTSKKKRQRNGGFRRKARFDGVDDFIDNGPAIRIKSRKKPGQGRRWPLLEDFNSGSDCVSGSSDYEFTISEEEREQLREAEEFCARLRRNMRSSSILMKNEEVEVHDSSYQHRKPPGQKGKEKIEEPQAQGRKGKEKIEDVKGEVGKQVCGICLSEENKRRVRGVLNCCTHYFCFSCIMEWSKVESRCPLCKQRFKTISKLTRSTATSDSREVVISVPERNQVYQPTEEELRSYTDPYDSVICSECHQGGDDALMLLCDICDSPAHTYCVGLGREVPEGNWYCDGCRPVALGSSNSQVQESVANPTMAAQSQPVRSSPVLHVLESIDNLMSSPRTPFSHGFRHLSSSRFSGRSVQGASLASGGGAPTLSERRWVQRHIQQLLSMDRMTSTTERGDGIAATNSTSNLYCPQIDQSMEPTAQHIRTRDVGTSYDTLFEERLCNNISSSIQNEGDPFSIGISNSRRSMTQDSTMFANGSVNGELWPRLSGTTATSDYESVHQFSSRSNIVADGRQAAAIKEESNFHVVKEQLQSMVKSHLKRLSRDIDLGTFKEIARSSTHTILAACGLEHKKSQVCAVPAPSACPHIELMAGGQTSLIKGCCSSCFDSFVRNVVTMILDIRMSSQWLRLGI